jgi:hypothetical protein
VGHWLDIGKRRPVVDVVSQLAGISTVEVSLAVPRRNRRGAFLMVCSLLRHRDVEVEVVAVNSGSPRQDGGLPRPFSATGASC